MANKRDLITEQILSIEDFNNVDAGLMRIIESDDEYRRIFEEYKEISALTSECVPEPVKNGVSLHDAVMDRVRSGDTAPRYTANTGRKFMFPMATAASLAIVLVASITATVVTRTKNNRDISDLLAEEEALPEYSQSVDVSDVPSTFEPVLDNDEKASEGDKEYVGSSSENAAEESENTPGVNNGSADDDRKPGIASDDQVTNGTDNANDVEDDNKDNTSETGSDTNNHRTEEPKKAEETAKGSDNGNDNKSVKGDDTDHGREDNAPSFTTQPYSDDISQDGSGSFVSITLEDNEQPSITVEPSKTEQPSTTEPPKTEQTSTTEPPETEQPSTTEPPKTEQPSTTEPPKTEQPSTTEPPKTEQPSTTEPPKTEQPTGGSASSNEHYGEEGADTESVSSAVMERIEQAQQHPDYNGELFDTELIMMFGEDLFIQWFDSIIGSPDFGKLYTVDEYLNYCFANGAV